MGSLAAAAGELPEEYGVLDVALIGIATHKLARLITKDKVTAFLRAPFTRYQEPAGHGELEEAPRGEGMRHAVGELLVCPYCVAQWIAAAFAAGLVGAPKLTRLLAVLFTAHAISDFLQLAFKSAEEAAPADGLGNAGVFTGQVTGKPIGPGPHGSVTRCGTTSGGKP